MNIPTLFTSIFNKEVWKLIKTDAGDERLPIKALDWHLDALVSWVLFNAKSNAGLVSTGYHMFAGWSTYSFSNQMLVKTILKRWLAISESPVWKEEVSQYIEILEGKEHGSGFFRFSKRKSTYAMLHELRKNPKAWEKQKDEIAAYVHTWYDRKEKLSFSKAITLGFYTLWLHQRQGSADSEAKAKACASFLQTTFQGMGANPRSNSIDVLMLSLYMYAAYQQFYEAQYISFFISLNKIIQQHAIVSPIPSFSGGVRASFPIYAGRKPFWISTEATLLALECFVKEKEYCGC